MSRRKNNVDLTRESSNVRRALRANRGLNHELKIIYQNIDIEQNMNDVSWRNRERLLRRHAIIMLGPHENLIARTMAERRIQQAIDSRNRAQSVVLPAIKQTPSVRTESSVPPLSAAIERGRSPLRRSTTIDHLDRQENSRAELCRTPSLDQLNSAMKSESPTRKRTASKAEIRIQPISAGPTPSGIEEKTYSFRSPPSMRQKRIIGSVSAVSLLQEKLDNFHIKLLGDFTNDKAGEDQISRQYDDTDDAAEPAAGKWESAVDANRLQRLSGALISSVKSARLRTSARKKRESTISKGPTWQSLTSAMHIKSSSIVQRPMTMMANPRENSPTKELARQGTIA